MAEHVEALAALPLRFQPGEVWEYGHSTDVLGRVVEIVAGAPLGEVLRERIFAPLGMDDTAFFTPRVEARPARRAPFDRDFTEDPHRRRRLHRAAALRSGGNGPALDDRRLRAVRCNAQQRRRARRRAHPRAAHDRLHGERPSCARRRQEPRAALARPRFRPRLLRAHRCGACADGGKRRRIFLGRRRRHRVLDFAARRAVRDPDDPGAGIPRIFPACCSAIW